MARIGGRKVLLLDTPGFDDSARENLEVLNEIVSQFYVFALRRTELETRGVIFLHDISETRFGGSQRKTLSILKALVGDEHMGNVIVGTTMWSPAGSSKFENEEQREQSLLDDQWGGICKTTRVPCDDKDAAAGIITDLLARPPVILLSQAEMIEFPHTVENTTAGRLTIPEGRMEMEELRREHARQEKRFEEETQKLRASLKKWEDEVRRKFEAESKTREEAAKQREIKLRKEFKEKRNTEEQAKIEVLEREKEGIRINEQREVGRFFLEEEIEDEKQARFQQVKEKARKRRKKLGGELGALESAMKDARKPPKLNFFMRTLDAVLKWFGFRKTPKDPGLY